VSVHQGGCLHDACARADIDGGSMSTRVTVAGHPVHPMLVTLPLGLWVFSLVCDFGFVFTGDERWAITAYFTLGGGIVGALLAAVPGLLDLLGMHDARAQRIGKYHLVLNLAIVAAQAVSFWLRTQDGLSERCCPEGSPSLPLPP
jgi:uncharacterized membrane protein